MALMGPDGDTHSHLRRTEVAPAKLPGAARRSDVELPDRGAWVGPRGVQHDRGLLLEPPESTLPVTALAPNGQIAENRATIAVNLVQACSLAAEIGMPREEFLRFANQQWDVEIRRVASDRRALSAMAAVYQTAVPASDPAHAIARQAALKAP